MKECGKMIKGKAMEEWSSKMEVIMKDFGKEICQMERENFIIMKVKVLIKVNLNKVVNMEKVKSNSKMDQLLKEISKTMKSKVEH